MLNGFTRRALAVFPFQEHYVDRNMTYKGRVNRVMRTLKTLLNESGIEVCYFMTDDAARVVQVSPDLWISTLSPGDRFFVENNCYDMSRDWGRVENYPDIYIKCNEKFPSVSGDSLEKRFEDVTKRDAMARRLIAKDFKLLVNFRQGTQPSLKYTPKDGSGVLYIGIDNVSFMPTLKIGTMKVSAVDILGIKNGDAPAYEWEV